VEAKIALVADRPERAADIVASVVDELDEASVDSPSNLMGLHAIAAQAFEQMGDHKSALFHERCRATIQERLAKLAVHVAGLTHKITHELDAARAERDRAMALHAELEREHDRLAALNAALKVQIAENQRLHDELKEQNYRDALTGLHNRRYLYERGPRIVDEAIERGTPLCLVMIDLDHFKQLNDVHGHVVGDRVLVELGRLLRERLRGDDIVCRVGGEEFAMILPATTIPVARDRLMTMLDDMRSLHAREGQAALPPNLTFSAGIAKAPDHPTSIDALMISADRLLYKAKNEGRARIESDPFDPPFMASASAVARQTLDH
jgi:diguanylate cyclase (GGDEF)-like protein